MFLKRLSILSFRNIAEAELDTAGQVNCFVGENGAGKTNALDAIHYLSMCKSALGTSDREAVRHGDGFFVVEGNYATDEGRGERVLCSFRPATGKKIVRGEKEYDRASEHVGLVPVVVVTPSDSALVSDAAEERRRFLNGFLSQLDRQYLGAAVRYNRLLAERNKLLKTSASGELMDVMDMQLAASGETIHARRAELIEQITPLAERFYKTLSADSEQVALHYRSELNDLSMEQLLVRNRERDAMNGFTTGGVHRDDLAMHIGGYPLRRYGSQGQQKSLLVALKLAQYAILADRRATKPILLLDDLFDKLDLARVERLLEIICATDFGQVFIADCNKVRLEELLSRHGVRHTLFNVGQGKITAL
jgi:DNA replication and repair protein RecF